jgi:hypothetical protein
MHIPEHARKRLGSDLDKNADLTIKETQVDGNNFNF